MMREAKLYLLAHHDWKPLTTLIRGSGNKRLKYQVTIFLINESTVINHYAILSLSPEADKLIEDYGGVQADKHDHLRNHLHDDVFKIVYGYKSNLSLLQKLNDS
jgi:hypothetical protein